MRLILLHPEVAGRSCADCQKYQYHDQGPGRMGGPVVRGGKQMLRPAGTRPPCSYCPKIVPGDEPEPENAQELSAKNELAYAHYKQCQAVGGWPSDGICGRNAAVIREAERHAERVNQTRTGLVVLDHILRGQ